MRDKMLPVRIIEAELTVRGSDGTTVHNHYRLITTLLTVNSRRANSTRRLTRGSCWPRSCKS
jgi:hypothetical protein